MVWSFGAWKRKKASFHLVDTTVPLMVTIGLFMRNDHVLSFDLQLNIDYVASHTIVYEEL
jgi:hypothetical protein